MIEKLKEYLRENKFSFVHVEYGQGGCDTCGYGAEELDVLDFDDLEKAIDAFAKEFKESK